uniref:Uncharacterized protein n=1 Tax=Arundo donax TaxID=35708 RepID=A0A0A9A854_ARUDO
MILVHRLFLLVNISFSSASWFVSVLNKPSKTTKQLLS